MVLVTHALPNEEPSRKIMLGENIWFILEVLSVDKNATFLFPTFKFNYHSVLFLQMVTSMLEYHRVSPHNRLGRVLCKRWFEEYHHQLMQEQGLSPVIPGDDIEHC